MWTRTWPWYRCGWVLKWACYCQGFLTNVILKAFLGGFVVFLCFFWSYCFSSVLTVGKHQKRSAKETDADLVSTQFEWQTKINRSLFFTASKEELREMAHLGANLCQKHLSCSRMPHNRRGSLHRFGVLLCLFAIMFFFHLGHYQLAQSTAIAKRRLITSSAPIPIRGNKLLYVDSVNSSGNST